MLLQKSGLGFEGRAHTNPIAIGPPGALGPMHRAELLLGGLLSSPLEPPELLRAGLARVRRGGRGEELAVPLGGACTAARSTHARHGFGLGQ